MALCHAARCDRARALAHSWQRAILLVKCHLRFVSLWVESNERRYATGGEGAAMAQDHFEWMQCDEDIGGL